MKNLFETRLQKIIWIIYLIVSIFVWLSVNVHNSNKICSLLNKGCVSVLPQIIIVTVLFIVLALILQKKNNER